MDSEQMPKQFEKTTEVLPFTKYGITSYEEFKKVEEEIQNLEWLKKAGLTEDEIKLYHKNEANLLENSKIESSVLRNRMKIFIRRLKITNVARVQAGKDKLNSEQSPPTTENIIEKLQTPQIKFYPEGHPMNDIKQLEENLFGHLKNDIIPLTKRRKLLRRFERKKERILAQNGQVTIPHNEQDQLKVQRPGSLWDVKEVPSNKEPQKRKIIGPQKQTMYTVKDNKIVRLEPANSEESNEYKAVDIVIPINSAEERLLEGTKMCLDDIKKIERFKDYVPGVPSKILFLKNIASSVSQDQLSILFNQFVLDNGGPIDVRLMSGKMRGQAFVSFHNEDIAIRALEEVNGTILKGRPIIIQFGRNTHHSR